RRGDDDGASAAVGRHEGEFGGSQLRVDRNRNGPGLDRAEKGGREIDCVMKAKDDALLRMNAEPAYEIGKPAHPLGGLGIAVIAVIVDESGLRAAPASDVSPNQIGRGIVSRRVLTSHPHPPGPQPVEIRCDAIIFPACSGQAALAIFPTLRPTGTTISAASGSGYARNGPAAA